MTSTERRTQIRLIKEFDLMKVSRMKMEIMAQMGKEEGIKKVVNFLDSKLVSSNNKKVSIRRSPRYQG